MKLRMPSKPNSLSFVGVDKMETSVAQAPKIEDFNVDCLPVV